MIELAYHQVIRALNNVRIELAAAINHGLRATARLIPIIAPVKVTPHP